MRTLLASTTVLFTIMLCLALGIACGYVVITAILRAFGHKPAHESAPATAAVVATTTGH